MLNTMTLQELLQKLDSLINDNFNYHLPMCVFKFYPLIHTRKNFSFHPATYNQSQLLIDHWARGPWYWFGFSHFVYLYWTVPFTFSVTVCSLSLYTANTTRTLWSMHILFLLFIGHRNKKHSSLTKLNILFFPSPTSCIITISHSSVNI